MRQYEERNPGVPAARFACWVGAVVDLLAGIQLLLPSSTHVLGFAGLRASGGAGLPATMAAVLMFGFSGILLWAQSRIVKRRAVMLVTLLVVVALAAANLTFGLLGDITWAALAGPLLIQTGLTALFSTAYFGLIRRRTVFGQRGRLQRLG